ncbi:MAG: glycosyltransferase [Chitinophagaceae bacterium]
MKVLWLSPNSGLLYGDVRHGSYNGEGWVVSLQKILQESFKDIHLGMVFVSDRYQTSVEKDGTTYFPVFSRKKSRLEKVLEYYGGYKKVDDNKYVSQLRDIVKNFKPDVIHLFGMESPFSSCLGKLGVPVVVHLQGILGPYDNAFFPVDINKSSFLFPITLKEWVLRNGYIYAKNSIKVRGNIEKRHFKLVRYVMGRTDWDFQVSRLLAPQSEYYHVDEVLRSDFYTNMGKWQSKQRGKFKIISVISETIYKGLDVILKTAHLLKTNTNIDFDWHVVGIKRNARMVHFFEKSVGVKSSDVNIIYKGVLTKEELCMSTLDADLYVHPSYIDNSPNSLCEAQLLGLPVIATNVGGVSSLIEHNKSGLLVPANAPFELAFYIKEIIENKELAKGLGEEAFYRASKRHNKITIGESLIRAYKACIKPQNANVLV